MRCDECKFWELTIETPYPEHDILDGECHRFPPQLNSIGVQESRARGNVDPAEWSTEVWRLPLVNAENWCGEFQPKPIAPTKEIITVLNSQVRDHFNVRIFKALMRGNYRDEDCHYYCRKVLLISELVELTAKQLSQYRNIGASCVNDVRTVLASLGLKLKGD
jgi:hypothetical protein